MQPNCLITTPKHKEIAEKLGLSPSVVTNLASVYVSEHPNTQDVTLDNIKEALEARQKEAAANELAIPKYTALESYASGGSNIVIYDRQNKKIILQSLKGTDYFMAYVQGIESTRGTASFRKEVFNALISKGVIKDLADLQSIVRNGKEAMQFMLWYEESFIKRGFVDRYESSSEADKKNMIYFAMKDAVDKARKYAEIHPLNTTHPIANNNTNMPKYYEGDITPSPNTIFVFGSNPEGRHGAGAAKTAVNKFGAIYGRGEGLQGNSYALPTKDLRVKENNSLRSISRETIIESIRKLYQTANEHPEKDFKIAYRNTDKASLNGYTGLEMIDMFKEAGSIPGNIIFSKEWIDTGKFNNINNNKYETTDDFRRVQEGSKRFSSEGVSSFQRGERQLNDEDKQRIGRILQRLLETNNNGGWHGVQFNLTHKNKDGKEGHFKIGRVNGDIFHDIFESVRTYLPNGELTDLHDNYEDCKCFITEDGLCGFAIEPDGNLVSVFSLSPSTNKGFLYAIKDLVREQGATHLDTYASNKQPLQEIYAKTLGFHTASTMDYNMEYDHDDIAKNHNNPQVVFMVNTDKVTPKHFNKNQYDKAQKHQLDSIEKPTINIYYGSNEHPELSNFAIRPFTYNFKDGSSIQFQSVEQAFQYLKARYYTNNTDNSNIMNQILKSTNGGHIKSLGRQIKGLNTKSWDDVSYKLMKHLIKLSFEQNPEALQKLKDTGNAILTHKQDTGKWGTDFPKILMEVREELKNYNPPVSKSITPIQSPQDTPNTDIDDSLPVVGVDRTKVDRDNPFLRVSTKFTPQQRRDRVNMITRDFSRYITAEINTLLNTLNQILQTLEAKEELDEDNKVELSKVQKAIGILSNGTELEKRHFVIQYRGLKYFLDQVLEDYKEAAEFEEDQLLKQKWQDVVDNFDYLFTQATYKIENIEHLKIGVSKRDSVENTVEKNNNIEEDRENDDDDENGSRASGNEGWSFKVRMVDPHRTLSSVTKKVLSNIIDVDINGNTKRDDLGLSKYLDEQYAHTVLISELSELIDDKDFCVKRTRETDGAIFYDFPALEKIKHKYPWVSQVIQELCDNPTEVSAFYADFRKDFIPYWASKTITNKDGKEVIVSFALDQQTGYESLKNSAIDNYETGTMLDEDAIYDYNRNLKPENIAKGLKIIEDLPDLDTIGQDEYEKFCEDLFKVLNMTGIPTSMGALKNLIDTDDGYNDITDIIDNLKSIYLCARRISGYSGKHLMSEASLYLNRLSRILGTVTANDNIGSFRVDDKTYYAYSAPNYISTQIKSLKSDKRRVQYLQDEFKQYAFFYNEKDGWEGTADDLRTSNDGAGKCWLDLLDTDEWGFQDELQTYDLLNIEGLPYDEWNSDLISERFILEYCRIPHSGNGLQYGIYNFPIFSDSPVATMIKAPRWENYEEEVIPRLRQVVRQELKRIKLVQDREAAGNTSEIACFDGKRGKQFCFFPFLNKWKSDDGRSFIKCIQDLDGNKQAINQFIDNVLSTYMKDEADKFVKKYGYLAETILKEGYALDYNHAVNRLREYFYNHEYATTQIIQMTVTDLAFYKDNTDFQKRYKEVYASGTRLNTQAKYGKEFRKSIYLCDQNMVSNTYTDLSHAVDSAVERWIKQGMDRKMAEMTGDSIKFKFRNICASDAQAYVSLKSMRSVLDMMGAWNDNMEAAFNRIQNNEWSIQDFNIIWQTIKPFVYTQIGKPSGVGDTRIKVPHQNKNSEFLLLAMYQMIAQAEGASPQLRALNEFMDKNDIDVVQFESAVKSGKQGTIDLNYSDSKLQKWIENNSEEYDKILDASDIKEGTDFDFFKGGNDVLLARGEITQKEYNERMAAVRPDYTDTMNILNLCVFNIDGTMNEEVVHSVPYKDYMIAQPTPEHLFDRESISMAVFGSQFRNLIVADIPADAIFKINGKEYNKEQILNLYNSLIVENLLDDYNKVAARFSTIEDFQTALLKVVEGNPKYGKNLLDALQLVDWTDPNTGVTKKVFNIPIYSPSIMSQVQDVVNSMFKNAVTRQKIKGAACILVSDFGFTDKLHCKYKKDKDGKIIGLEYAETYLPWYSKKFFEPFLKDVVGEDGKTYQEIDIEKCPKELLEGIGYRIPTENKYSMMNFRIKGFLPQQNGGVIMLPADLTIFAGSDFDKHQC